MIIIPKRRPNIGCKYDGEIAVLHAEGKGSKLIARILNERHSINLVHNNVTYAYKRLGLAPHIGSSNGAIAKWGPSADQNTLEREVLEIKKTKRQQECAKYIGFKDLPLFTPSNCFKMRYRNEPEFRAYQIQRSAARKKAHPEENRECAKRWTKSDKGKASRSKPENRVIRILRKRVSSIISGRKGYSSTSVIRGIGCTRIELIAHLEKGFQIGMTWENYGDWHIDHIIPLASAKVASFDETVTNLSRLSHYTNLQPLWAADNMAKGARMPSLAPHPTPGQVTPWHAGERVTIIIATKA